MPVSHLSRVFSDQFLSSLDLNDVFIERQKWFANAQDADLLSAFQYLNLKTYLPDDILVKVDRMSMYHALECRSPFLDYRVVEFAAKLPSNLKIGPAGERKYLLRTLLSRYVPETITSRPKMGFTVPWSDWCQGAIKQTMINNWVEMDTPYFKKDAAHYLFPANKPGWPTRQWNAFCTMNFFNQ